MVKHNQRNSSYKRNTGLTEYYSLFRAQPHVKTILLIPLWYLSGNENELKVLILCAHIRQMILRMIPCVCHSAAVCCFLLRVTALFSVTVGLSESVLTNENIQTSALMRNMWSVWLGFIHAQRWLLLRPSSCCLFIWKCLKFLPLMLTLNPTVDPSETRAVAQIRSFWFKCSFNWDKWWYFSICLHISTWDTRSLLFPDTRMLCLSTDKICK